MTQQALFDACPPLTFVVICPECGPVAAVPVDDDDWHAAECWSYLAHVQHRKDVHA